MVQGQDYVYIALGLGALYLVSELGEPVKTIGNNVASVTDIPIQIWNNPLNVFGNNFFANHFEEWAQNTTGWSWL